MQQRERFGKSLSEGEGIRRPLVQGNHHQDVASEPRQQGVQDQFAVRPSGRGVGRWWYDGGVAGQPTDAAQLLRTATGIGTDPRAFLRDPRLYNFIEDPPPGVQIQLTTAYRDSTGGETCPLRVHQDEAEPPCCSSGRRTIGSPRWKPARACISSSSSSRGGRR